MPNEVTLGGLATIITGILVFVSTLLVANMRTQLARDTIARKDDARNAEQFRAGLLTQFDTLKQTNDLLRADRDSYRNEARDHLTVIGELRERLAKIEATAVADRASFHLRIAELQGRLDVAVDARKQSDNELADARNKRDELQTRITALTEQLNKQGAELATAKQTATLVTQLQAKVEAMQKQIDEMREQHQRDLEARDRLIVTKETEIERLRSERDGIIRERDEANRKFGETLASLEQMRREQTELANKPKTGSLTSSETTILTNVTESSASR